MVDYDFDEVLQIIHSAEPTLTSDGVNSGKLFKDDPIKDEEFKRALRWVDNQQRLEKINKKLNSYDMKHYAEEYGREEYGRHMKTSSGAVIAAIIYLGIPYRKIEGSREIWAAIKVIKKRKKKDGLSTDYLLAFIEDGKRQSGGADKDPAA